MATQALRAGENALETYEAFAPFYDAFTAGYEYDSWMGDVEAWARECGLGGRDLLDAACGTGNSFMPMLSRGYRVVGCDLSPAMVAQARAKARGRAQVVVADLRALPWRERFDLVTCVDDSVNYLLSTADLIAAMRSIHDALRPGGLAVFDFNSLLMYRTSFASDFTVGVGARRFRWRGDGREMPAGELASGTIELHAHDREPVPLCRHLQRHHPIETIEMACGEAGLAIVEMRGESPTEGLVRQPDEGTHLKIACLARRPRPAGP
jgi:SAM-dependent methyltransferase